MMFSSHCSSDSGRNDLVLSVWDLASTTATSVAAAAAVVWMGGFLVCEYPVRAGFSEVSREHRPPKTRVRDDCELLSFEYWGLTSGPGA